MSNVFVATLADGLRVVFAARDFATAMKFANDMEQPCAYMMQASPSTYDQFNGSVFNLAAHDHLINLGARHEQHPAFFEDDGDVENGPHLSGCIAHDSYVLDDVEYVIYEDGSTDTGPWCPPPPEPRGV